MSFKRVSKSSNKTSLGCIKVRDLQEEVSLLGVNINISSEYKIGWKALRIDFLGGTTLENGI